MDWLLLCPICACVVESFGSLKSVGDKYHCPMCRCDYESALDEFIAVTFTVSRTVRPRMVKKLRLLKRRQRSNIFGLGPVLHNKLAVDA